MKTFQQIGTEHGELVARKNAAYGSSFAKCGDYLRILFPDGIRPDQYADVLLLARDFDKNMRIANHRDAFGENPYSDKIGYAICGYDLHQRNEEGSSTKCPGDANGAALPSKSDQPGSAVPSASDSTAPRQTGTIAHEPSPQPDGYSTLPDSATAATATEAASASAGGQHANSDGPCLDCGYPCEIWFAPNELWNRVVPGRAGLLCLRCFILRAESRGISPTAWELRAESATAATATEAASVGAGDPLVVPEGFYVETHPSRMSAAALEAGAIAELLPIEEGRAVGHINANGSITVSRNRTTWTLSFEELFALLEGSDK